MFNHEEFEDFLDYVPVKQLALADIFRDATAVIDSVGWDPRINPPREIGADKHDNAITMSDIHANRRSVEALNRIFNTYTNTIAT